MQFVNINYLLTALYPQNCYLIFFVPRCIECPLYDEEEDEYTEDEMEDVINRPGWKLLSFSQSQELSQDLTWLLIGCTRVNIQSKAIFVD